ncbi:MAG: hypothetical protein KA028_00195 [Candidatus Pacebacteria bacterium]|nr:hypothetical protein [Candidatus Paceibacterota bacterium]MBP9851843.1 hypothetical protein [Candidatus Paceibacterota bacterium]
MKNLLSKSMKAAVLALVFGAVTVLAAPFQGPTQTPAVNNAPLPINVSMNDQFKQGGIGISSLLIGPGSATPGATNASIFGSVRIGSGTVTNGSGYLQVNDRVAVGSTPTGAPISPTSVGQYGVIAGGIVTGLKGFWTPSNSYVGRAALTTPPTLTLSAPGNAGSVIADRFCFSGTNGACTTTWGAGGSVLPNGNTSQTLRYSANNVLSASSTLVNDGTNVGVNGQLLLNLTGSATDNIVMTAGPGADHNSIVINKDFLHFWSTVGLGHSADIRVRDVTAEGLRNTTLSHVCADTEGKLILCAGAPTGSPMVTLSVSNPSIATAEQTTFGSQAITVSWSTQGMTGGTCTADSRYGSTGGVVEPTGWSGSVAAGGGSQSANVNEFGTTFFLISCTTAASQTLTATASVDVTGYRTFTGNGTFTVPNKVTTLGIKAAGSGGSGATAYQWDGRSMRMIANGGNGSNTVIDYTNGTNLDFTVEGGSGATACTQGTIVCRPGIDNVDGTDGNQFPTNLNNAGELRAGISGISYASSSLGLSPYGNGGSGSQSGGAGATINTTKTVSPGYQFNVTVRTGGTPGSNNMGNPGNSGVVRFEW